VNCSVVTKRIADNALSAIRFVTTLQFTLSERR